MKDRIESCKYYLKGREYNGYRNKCDKYEPIIENGCLNNKKQESEMIRKNEKY